MADDRDIRDCAEIDAHLAPFVDGEEPPAVRRAVEAHLRACPPCKRHADSESSARGILHSHRDELRVAAPEALRRRCANLQPAAGDAQPPVFNRRSAMVRRWVPLSLAATLVLAFAGVFLLGLNNPVEALAATLALDHAKCFKVSEQSSHDAAASARSWEQKQGWPIGVPEPRSTEELELVDVRHCYSSDGWSAHLMYRWRGSPLSVYVLPAGSGRAGSVGKLGHETVIWSANGRTYAVVADGHPQGLTHVVDYMKANVR
jgi:anti-sigma factor (TIGR02949 family)